MVVFAATCFSWWSPWGAASENVPKRTESAIENFIVVLLTWENRPVGGFGVRGFVGDGIEWE